VKLYSLSSSVVTNSLIKFMCKDCS
jgi:hypothetical protein